MIIFDRVFKGYRTKGAIKWVLRNFSGVFPDDQGIGILCARGGGKTTFINMLANVEAPSRGSMVRTKDVSWTFGYRGHLSANLTVRQNIRFLTTVYNRDFDRTLEFIRDFSDLGSAIDQETRKLSMEMRARLSASAFFGLRFRHHLFDDNFEVGDQTFRRKTFQYLVDNKSALGTIIATSNPDVVRALCTVGAVLKDGTLTIHDTIDDAILHYREGWRD